MNKNRLVILSLALVISSCSGGSNHEKQAQMSAWEDEILKVEQDFYTLSKNEGMAVAFEQYADSSAVILRKGKLIKGRENISDFFKAEGNVPGAKLSWAPSHVTVSESGDLAYTYGKYIFSYPDDSGNVQSNEGFFQTIWKRQEDGSWKYVWD